jgi:hypothetical protein
MSDIPQAALHAQRIASVTRLMRATEMHVHDVEKRFARNKSKPASRESDARRLAVLAKTMRELITLDMRDSADDGAGKSAQADDDLIPRDVDEPAKKGCWRNCWRALTATAWSSRRMRGPHGRTIINRFRRRTGPPGSSSAAAVPARPAPAPNGCAISPVIPPRASR